MTKQVQLADDAYERLLRAKRPGDSFSDVIRRAFPTGTLADLAMLRRTQADIEAHERILKEGSRLDAERANKVDRWRQGDFL